MNTDDHTRRCDGSHLGVAGRPELCDEHLARRDRDAEAAEQLAREKFPEAFTTPMTRDEAKADAEQALRGVQEPVSEPLPDDLGARVYPTDSGTLTLPPEGVGGASGTWVEPDLVNHPPHYTAHPSGVECITITEHMGFNVGNAVKYLWRADEKGSALEDLRKASWYVQREIERRTRG